MSEYDIFSHPDLQPSAADREDIQTQELMADAKKIDAMIGEGSLRTEASRRLALDMLNRKWAPYIGQRVYVAGKVYAQYEGRVVPVAGDVRASGFFQGFQSDISMDEHGVRESVSYCFSSQAVPDGSAEDIPFTARVDAHIEFPDIVSYQRLEALVAPLIDLVDEAMTSPDVRSMPELLSALASVPLFRDIDQQDWGLAYGALAQYLNKESGIDDVTALTGVIDGLTYHPETWTPVDTTGRATLMKPSFFVNLGIPQYPELCLRAQLVQQQGQRPVVEERIIPLDALSDLAEVGDSL